MYYNRHKMISLPNPSTPGLKETNLPSQICSVICVGSIIFPRSMNRYLLGGTQGLLFESPSTCLD